MRGKLTTIHPSSEMTHEVLEFPDDTEELRLLEKLQAAVGGWIEQVPYFTTMLNPDDQTVSPCVVFCNEEGKLNGLEINYPATVLWEVSLMNTHGISWNKDVLVGPVVVVTGDEAFMRAM